MADALPILITGASRGLGAACAEVLAERAHIVAVARTTGGLEELDDRIQAAGGAATLAPMNVSDAAAMAHLCRSIYDRWGGVSIWVHAAIHAPPLAPVDHIDAKDFTTSILVNATATAQLIPMVAPLLGGTGTAVFFDDPRAGEKFFGAYAASKAAQMALVRAWAAEQRTGGTRVRTLTPKPMPTALRARFFPGEDKTALAKPMDEARRLMAQI